MERINKRLASWASTLEASTRAQAETTAQSCRSSTRIWL